MQLTESWLAISSLAILSGAIIGGVITAFVRITDKNTAFDTGLLHGRAGVIGTILLVISVFIDNEPVHYFKSTIGLLVLTILAGVTLYFVIRRKGILPKSIIFIHGALAISAVHALIFALRL